jgi:hypothetical protein
MDKPINLTKKAVGAGMLRLSECGTHITNGHWACRRELLKQAALLTTVEAIEAMFPRASVQTVPASSVDSVVPHFGNPVTYTRTNWVQTCPNGMGDAVLFVGGKDNKSQAWVDRTYADLFDLDEVTGEECSGDTTINTLMVGTREDWQVLVMPKRLYYQEGLR